MLNGRTSRGSRDNEGEYLLRARRRSVGQANYRQAVTLLGAVMLAVAVVGVVAATILAERGGAENRRAGGSGKAKNIIYMMGDGMGQAQRDAIQLATVGAYGRLEMDKLP